MSEKLVEIRQLRTTFTDKDGLIIPAVDGISFHINKNEILGIVGESGCGKSVTSLSIMRLIPEPPGKIECEAMIFNGQDLMQLKKEQMRQIRGNDISMIFQEPMTSLNPVFTVGDQIAEAIQLHQNVNKKEAVERAVQMLRKVGIPSPEQRVYEYPHQLSGGMRQRVMIAMALSCSPKLLIADEPTTALDVTIQAQILDIMQDLKKDMEMSIMLITHDLGVVAQMAERIIVMYAGKIVEEATTIALFEETKHPYTQGLLNSIPKMEERVERLYVIEGVVPHPQFKPQGCQFNPRCPYAQEKCRQKEPQLEHTANRNHKVSCWYPLNKQQRGLNV